MTMITSDSLVGLSDQLFPIGNRTIQEADVNVIKRSRVEPVLFNIIDLKVDVRRDAKISNISKRLVLRFDAFSRGGATYSLG